MNMLQAVLKHVISALFFIPALAAATVLEYGSSVENTHWSVNGSIFECRFEQTIPGYGKAVFYHEAGEDVSFQLESLRNLMDYSSAQVSILPPPWQPSAKSEPLGEMKVVNETPNLSLDSKRSNQFLHALLEGKWPSIAHHSYYDKKRFIRVHVSAVSFNDHYPNYLECVEQLLPMNFGQVARSKILFGIGDDGLDPPDMQVIDRIAHYILNDPRVFAVYLDGHSDSQGRRYDNREISRTRVENVARYLIKLGINPEMVTSRFHGDRYPVATNNTAAGRAENRRVTIRLERRADMAVPEELLFKAKVPVKTTPQAAPQLSANKP